MNTLDDIARTEVEAAAFRRLIQHLRDRADVQNIDLMDLAGFCRNCLANWLQAEADSRGLPVSREAARAHVYGMPYEDWKAKHQPAASVDQKAAFAAAFRRDPG